MDHFIYIAASGASEAMFSQAINAHNLANASTTGFRADLLVAQSAHLSGGGLESRVFAGVQNQGIDFREGAINVTGGELDVAVNGQGWLAILSPDGTEAYSRRGDMRVNEYGQLMNGAGQQVLGNSGPIAVPPFTTISIASDGTISMVPLGEDPNTLAVVDRIKLVNPDHALLTKNETGLIQMIDPGSQAEPDASVRLVQGSLESSNVDSVGAMVRMIEMARQFETHTKMMETAEQIDQASAELMSMN